MSILAVSGSLRAVSSNTALLRAAAAIAPAHLQVILFEGIGELPHFNPDLDGLESQAPPPAVQRLRLAVAAADGLLISSPEYAHGVPGVLKNALDWLVSRMEIPDKPVVLLNASPHATHAVASLRETLTTMSTRVLPDAVLPMAGRKLDVGAIIADPPLAAGLRQALDSLAAAIAEHRHDTRLSDSV